MMNTPTLLAYDRRIAVIGSPDGVPTSLVFSEDLLASDIRAILERYEKPIYVKHGTSVMIPLPESDSVHFEYETIDLQTYVAENEAGDTVIVRIGFSPKTRKWFVRA